MNYYTIAPPPHLAAFVRCYWVFEGEATAAAPYVYRGYADGCPELVFFVKGGFDDILSGGILKPSPTAHLHAQSTTFSRAITKDAFSIFGCYLYPYALSCLFGFPVQDFNGCSVELRAFAGRTADDLEAKVLAATSEIERTAIVSKYLTERLRQFKSKLPPVTNLIHQMVNGGVMSIDSMAADSGLSIRQFERRFKEFSGFSPKLYSRLMRFHNSVKYFGSQTPLLQIALECGYYDQSHFINEFKEFSGFNPKEFLYGQAEGSEYMNFQ